MPVIRKTVLLSYIPKSDFFKYMLAACILYHRVSVYCGHSQDIEGVFQRQLLRTGSISPAFYRIILQMDAQRTLLVLHVYPL